MRVLITGGTGFLGSHVAALLLAQGHIVAIMGRNFSPVQNLLKLGAIPVVADLRDVMATVAACRGMDAVVHAGALSAAWGPPAEFQAVNVEGTRAVLAGCRKHGVARLVHISSPAVVFDGRDHVETDESRPYARRFSSAYARSKQQAEVLVNTATDVAGTILRPKAIFGPGDRALLPRLVAAATQGRLRRFGKGDNLVDLTYVENVAQAVALALSAPAAVGKTYFITNDEHVVLWPVIAHLLTALGLSSRLRPLPVPVALAAAAVMEAQAVVTGREPLLTRYGVGVLACTQTYNIAAARRDLGYVPAVTVANAIERTLAALRPRPTFA